MPKSRRSNKVEQVKQADAILSADWHIMDGQPSSRTDDYRQAMEEKLGFISELQHKHYCPVLVAGDIFHKWKSSPEILAWALEHIPMEVICIPGQHDLPGHNIDLIHRSGLAVLEASGQPFRVLYPPHSDTLHLKSDLGIVGFPWESELGSCGDKGTAIALCHILISDSERDCKIIGADKAHSLFKKLKGFDLIVTGDNHKPFVLEHEGRLLVNPGSLMRMTADQIDHKPRVYLWYADTNTVEPVYLPIVEGVITREQADAAKHKQDRNEALIKRLETHVELGLDFKENTEVYMRKHKTTKPVRQIVREVFDAT